MTLEILENTEKAKAKFHDIGWGSGEEELTNEHIQALLTGKCLGFFDGEYTTVVTLKKEESE